ncbi:MBL fold metallo-hydrolase [Fictibacillus terranigra]|uniref:MBL fold metallo-hydrolase n=1 Tax=Fictibacillus terranigra TaxID=3058424 RepID=A0ABT8E9W7_9BACL|nr:MBL fold metallo-hydrolase [Fictibacillus sp. CENA-BCM004]MDN4074662.1 MBL fold metallo-hydrolase [Fictibacillus sp. CENA-BCM004]
MLNQNIITISLPTPFPVGDVNVYLIRGEKLTLVDCGPKTPEAWKIFREKLAENGLAEKDIEQVIFTHYHPDHVGLYAYFKSPVPAVLASLEEIPYLSQQKEFFVHRNRFYEGFYKKMGMPEEAVRFEYMKLKKYLEFSAVVHATPALYEGEEVPGLPGWTMMKTPGHSPDHLSLFHEESGIMIGGDFLLQRISSNALIEPPLITETERPKPLLQYRNSLKTAAGLPIDVILPGHGLPISNSSELIKERLAQQNSRAHALWEMLSGEKTAYELSKLLFPGIYQKEPGLTLSETVGHLDLLEEEGRILAKDLHGIIYYKRAEGA